RGTVTLMAGIDLLTGTVHALVKDRHRSREFIEFLKILDTAYPAATAIKVILDNHSAHISRETKTWLAAQPDGRFAFVFTPKHGSWLNLVEGFFSKAARSALRHIRVNSTHELKQRIIEFISDLNRDPSSIGGATNSISRSDRYVRNFGNDVLGGVELPIALFDAASALVPGNGGADVVWASPLARCGDLLLRFACRQNQDPIVEGR